MDENNSNAINDEPADETTASRDPSRRQFLAGAGAVVAGAMLVSVASAATGKTPAVRADQRGMMSPVGKGVVDLGIATSIKVGMVVDHTQDAGLFLSRTKDGLIALSPTCTHQGCDVAWYADAKLFGCPCHGAAFGPDGAVQQGPARAPLAAYSLSLVKGHVKVNTNKLTPRQAVKPADFTVVK